VLDEDAGDGRAVITGPDPVFRDGMVLRDIGFGFGDVRVTHEVQLTVAVAKVRSLAVSS
jgi:hypothetical protein